MSSNDCFQYMAAHHHNETSRKRTALSFRQLPNTTRCDARTRDTIEAPPTNCLFHEFLEQHVKGYSTSFSIENASHSMKHRVTKTAFHCAALETLSYLQVGVARRRKKKVEDDKRKLVPLQDSFMAILISYLSIIRPAHHAVANSCHAIPKTNEKSKENIIQGSRSLRWCLAAP